MLTDPLAIILLLVTGVVALVMGILLLRDYLINKKIYHLAWAISFIVLFVAGVLIILNGYVILEDPLVPVVSAFIPACLAIGLFNAAWNDKPYGLYYTIFTVVMIVALAVVRLIPDFAGFSTPVLMALHIPSGLSIVGIPLYTALKKETEMTSIFYSVGGLLISIGGVLLAISKTNSAIAELTFNVLPLLLVIVGVLFVLGILLPNKWKVEVPYLSR
ncbi:MAG: hypothetical protein ACXAC8_02575 [Candidatus Hodarchaeales archaeon]|jgi:hypothetical protein